MAKNKFDIEIWSLERGLNEENFCEKLCRKCTPKTSP